MTYKMMKVLLSLARLQKVTLVSAADFARYYNNIKMSV